MGLREKVALVLIAVVLFMTVCSVCMPQSLKNNPFEKYLKKIKSGKNKSLSKYGNEDRQERQRFLDDFPRQNVYKSFNFPVVDYLSDASPKVSMYVPNTEFVSSSKTSSIDVLSDSALINNLRKEKRRKRKNKQIEKAYTRDDLPVATLPESFRNQEPSVYFTEMGLFPEVQYPLTATETWTPSYWNPMASNKEDQVHTDYRPHDNIFQILKQKTKNVDTFTQPSKINKSNEMFAVAKKSKEEIPKIDIVNNITDVKTDKEFNKSTFGKKISPMLEIVVGNKTMAEKLPNLEKTKTKSQKLTLPVTKKKKFKSENKILPEAHVALKEPNTSKKVMPKSNASRLKSKQFSKKKLQSSYKTNTCSPDNLTTPCTNFTEVNDKTINSVSKIELSNLEVSPEFEYVVPKQTDVSLPSLTDTILNSALEDPINLTSEKDSLSKVIRKVPLIDNSVNEPSKDKSVEKGSDASLDTLLDVIVNNHSTKKTQNHDMILFEPQLTDFTTKAPIESNITYPTTLNALHREEVPAYPVSFTGDSVRRRILDVLSTEKLSVSFLREKILKILQTEELTPSEDVSVSSFTDRHLNKDINKYLLTDRTSSEDILEFPLTVTALSEIIPEPTVPDKFTNVTLMEIIPEPSWGDTHLVDLTEMIPKPIFNDDLGVIISVSSVTDNLGDVIAELKENEMIYDDSIAVVPEPIVTQALADNLREIISKPSSSQALINDLREIIRLLTVWNSRIGDLEEAIDEPTESVTKRTRKNETNICYEYIHDPSCEMISDPVLLDSDNNIELNSTSTVELTDYLSETTTAMPVAQQAETPTDNLKEILFDPAGSDTSTDDMTDIITKPRVDDTPADNFTEICFAPNSLIDEDLSEAISEHLLTDTLDEDTCKNDHDNITQFFPEAYEQIKVIPENDPKLTEYSDKVTHEPTFGYFISVASDNSTRFFTEPKPTLIGNSGGVIPEPTPTLKNDLKVFPTPTWNAGEPTIDNSEIISNVIADDNHNLHENLTTSKIIPDSAVKNSETLAKITTTSSSEIIPDLADNTNETLAEKPTTESSEIIPDSAVNESETLAEKPTTNSRDIIPGPIVNDSETLAEKSTPDFSEIIPDPIVNDSETLADKSTTDFSERNPDSAVNNKEVLADKLTTDLSENIPDSAVNDSETLANKSTPDPSEIIPYSIVNDDEKVTEKSTPDLSEIIPDSAVYDSETLAEKPTTDSNEINFDSVVNDSETLAEKYTPDSSEMIPDSTINDNEKLTEKSTTDLSEIIPDSAVYDSETLAEESTTDSSEIIPDSIVNDDEKLTEKSTTDLSEIIPDSAVYDSETLAETPTTDSSEINLDSVINDSEMLAKKPSTDYREIIPGSTSKDNIYAETPTFDSRETIPRADSTNIDKDRQAQKPTTDYGVTIPESADGDNDSLVQKPIIDFRTIIPDSADSDNHTLAKKLTTDSGDIITDATGSGNDMIRMNKKPTTESRENIPESADTVFKYPKIEIWSSEFPSTFAYHDTISSLTEENKSEYPISFISTYIPRTDTITGDTTEIISEATVAKTFADGSNENFRDSEINPTLTESKPSAELTDKPAIAVSPRDENISEYTSYASFPDVFSVANETDIIFTYDRNEDIFESTLSNTLSENSSEVSAFDIATNKVHESSNELDPESELVDTLSGKLTEIIYDSRLNNTRHADERTIERTSSEFPPKCTYDDTISSLADETESKYPVFFVSTYMPKSNETLLSLQNDTETFASVTNILWGKPLLQSDVNSSENICPVINTNSFENQCYIFDEPDDLNSSSTLKEKLLLTSAEELIESSPYDPLYKTQLLDVSLTDLIMGNFLNFTTVSKDKTAFLNVSDNNTLSANDETLNFSDYTSSPEDDIITPDLIDDINTVYIINESNITSSEFNFTPDFTDYTMLSEGYTASMSYDDILADKYTTETLQIDGKLFDHFDYLPPGLNSTVSITSDEPLSNEALPIQATREFSDNTVSLEYDTVGEKLDGTKFSIENTTSELFGSSSLEDETASKYLDDTTLHEYIFTNPLLKNYTTFNSTNKSIADVVFDEYDSNKVNALKELETDSIHFNETSTFAETMAHKIPDLLPESSFEASTDESSTDTVSDEFDTAPLSKESLTDKLPAKPTDIISSNETVTDIVLGQPATDIASDESKTDETFY